MKEDQMDVREFPPEQLLGPLNDVERKNAPPRLYVVGDLALLSQGARVSIVGTRKPSKNGVSVARRFAKELVGRGVVVVSGMAEGIDTAAHEAVLAADGKTIAVIGTSLDRAYPAKNRDLQSRIAKEHLLISQFRIGTPSQPRNFPMRNRTMALISDATIIVEAGEKSGTLHQGWEALRLGRPLFLYKPLVSNDALTWPREMLRYGAIPVSQNQLDLILAFLPERIGDEASQAAF
jgi:DNA processing protein